MKSTFVSVMLLAIATSSAQYPSVTIRQIQEVPADSLRLLDSCGVAGYPCRPSLQYSPFKDDTVTVVAVCIVRIKVFSYTASGYTLLLYDTATVDRWRGLFVRCTADTMQHLRDGIANVEAGDVVRVTGVVQEFQTSPINTLTQLQPIPGIPIQIVGLMPIPPPVHAEACDFYAGSYPVGRVRYGNGEPFESMRIKLDGLTVTSHLSDCSFLSLSRTACPMASYDATRRCIMPPLGSLIDTLRGFIFPPLAGGEINYGFRIAPVSPGDVILTSVKQEDNTVASYSLPQNYPNPFNPNTKIKYQISIASAVTLKVFDILGREMATLVDEVRRPGTYEVMWDGYGVASGVYFCRFNVGGFVQTRKLLLSR